MNTADALALDRGISSLLVQLGDDLSRDQLRQIVLTGYVRQNVRLAGCGMRRGCLGPRSAG
jgi:hypothetical protein